MKQGDKVIKVDITLVDDIDVIVDFQPTRYLSSFDSDVLYNEYYEWRKEIVGVEIQTVESNYGTLYVQDNYARTFHDFIREVIYNDKDFINYVMFDLDDFDKKRLSL